MFTSYITSKNYVGLSASYIWDNQIDFLSKRISIDGYLTTCFLPVLSGNKDFFKSNYSLFYLTDNINFDSVTDFKKPNQQQKNLFCNIYSKLSGTSWYFTFTDELDDSLLNTIIYDQSFTGKLSGLNDLNYFNIDITDPFVCTISHNYKMEDFYLAFNPASLNINFAILSSFTGVTNYNRLFYYTLNLKDNSLSLQARIGGQAYQVIRDVGTRRLALCAVEEIAFTDTRSIFYLSAFSEPTLPEVTLDWASYTKTFNQNNIDIDREDSFFNIKSNFLLHSEYVNILKEQAGLATNILPLKTQLNIRNNQGRGNIFPNEDPVNYRNYVSVFGGNRQEKGYEKLHLQYESYTYPFTFKSGQTTWFHTPQNMYPFNRLNVQTTKLVEAGAVAGDHPLRSDKIFKKIGEYKYSSNQGDSSGEATGQWLCAWLSGGSTIATKPIWVDRFYNPKISTPFEAITAPEGNVTYIPSYECYNLGLGIVDMPSSLTFEPGGLYAYSRIGKVDAEQNVKVLLPYQQQKNLTTFSRYNGLKLDPVKERENILTYTFEGTEYGTIDVRNLNFDLNTFSISFWASRTDWSSLIGYQLGGNFNEYGFGFFNYKLVTPLLFVPDGVNINAYNQDLELVNNFNNLKSVNQQPQYFMRRDALNAFHCINNTLTLMEVNLQETIVDATSAMFSAPIKDVTNDPRNGYVLLTNNSLSGIDLASNLPFPVTVYKTVSESGSYKQVRNVANKIILIDGDQSVVRNTAVYFLSAGIIRRWDTITETLTSFIGSKNKPIECFNIDKFNNVWTASGNLISVYGEYQKPLFTVALTASQFTSTRPSIVNITFMENFYSGQLQETVIVSASGSQVGKLILSKFNYNGGQEKSILVNSNPTFNKNSDPTNHNWNYAYIADPIKGNNNYSFKIRLYNQFNTEDLEIPEPIILATDLNPGYHHFSTVVNTVNGTVKIYLDGELYSTAQFTPKKYVFIPLVTDTIVVGACPFYSGLLFNDYLQKLKKTTSYYVRDLKLQNIYIHNKELNRIDIAMLYKEKIPPQDLVWDVPSGRRNYIETVSRYFKQSIPGAKSTLFNVYINDNLMDAKCRSYLETAVVKSLKDTIPGYSKLNKLKWITNLPGLTGEYLQPYFPGNTLTDAGFDR